VKWAVLSDIHGNLEALDAVLRDIDRRNDDGERVEEILCLGDVFGYGPNPRECAELVRRRCKLVVAGNHEHGVLEKIRNPSLGLNRATGFGGRGAREGVLWAIHQLFLDATPIRGDDAYTQSLVEGMLSPDVEHRLIHEFCDGLNLNSEATISWSQRLLGGETPLAKRLLEKALMNPETRGKVDQLCQKLRHIQEAREWISAVTSWPTLARVDGALLVHDNPMQPGDARYLLDASSRERLKPSSPVHTIEKAFTQFEWNDLQFIFFGHSHIPGVYTSEKHPGKVIANPGSVGIPRGAKLEATYLIWDTQAKGKAAVKHARIPLHGWRETGEKMERCGLPNKFKTAAERGAEKELD
jgi:predicted phosphodiesterase